jgi:hypothetical protein
MRHHRLDKKQQERAREHVVATKTRTKKKSRLVLAGKG